MRGFFLLFFLGLFLLGSACAPLQVHEPSYFNSSAFIAGDFALSPAQEKELSDARRRNKARYKGFPDDHNQYVRKWLSYYVQGNGRGSMKRYLERSQRYLDLMGDIFEEEGLPRDLVYISMTESGFYPYARSKAHAVGYWQFIKPTGRHYGLRMDSYVDERQDFVLSTQAAVRYLKDLYGVFQDWRLSMAAYNCGESCVRKAMKAHNSKNFWRLVERKALPAETRNYIPKIIAMRRIALDPSSYGFSSLNYREPLEYDLVSLRQSSSLSHISRALGAPLSELKSLNSKFKTDIVPVEGAESHIRVPIGI